ncbi:hypothetical protein ACF0H5_023708 [Mactra antiquata]
MKMQLSLAVCLTFGFGLVLCTGARNHELMDYIDSNNVDVPDSGHCKCAHWGCWCYGWDDNTEIHVIFTVDEFRKQRCSNALIEAGIHVGNDYFEKRFPANRFEDFCHSLHGKRFCFRIDIQETTTSHMLHACLKLSRPHELKVGCFELPLLSAGCLFANVE